MALSSVPTETVSGRESIQIITGIRYAEQLRVFFREIGVTNFTNLKERLPMGSIFRTSTRLRDAETIREAERDRVECIPARSYENMIPGAAKIFGERAAVEIVYWVKAYSDTARQEYHSLHEPAGHASSRGAHQRSASLYREMASISRDRLLPYSYEEHSTLSSMSEYRKVGMEREAALVLGEHPAVAKVLAQIRKEKEEKERST